MNLNRAQKLSLVSSKGGVGKSTWAINGACALADMGLNVLCIDLDPQGSLSKFFCTPQELRQGPGLVEFVTRSDTAAIRNTLFPRISLIANNDDGETLNQWMREEFSASFALKTMLARVEGDFDIIVIDTQGKDGRGQLQEMALVASDIVIVPTTPDLISIQELPRSISGGHTFTVAGMSFWLRQNALAISCPAQYVAMQAFFCRRDDSIVFDFPLVRPAPSSFKGLRVRGSRLLLSEVP